MGKSEDAEPGAGTVETQGPDPAPVGNPFAGLWQGVLDRVVPSGASGPRADSQRRRAPYPMDRADHCVILGPVSSGKTALLYSLARCAEVHSHSYQGRYDVDITGGNDAFDGYRGKGIETVFRGGLVVTATQRNQFSAPEFSFEVHSNRASPRLDRVATFSSFDASGGLLEKRMRQPDAPAEKGVDADQAKDQATQDREGITAHKALLANLAQAESVIFCIPLGQVIEPGERDFLIQRIYELRERPSLRRLVVCFTMYEKLGHGHGRDAYRRLACRSAARDLMADALGRRDHGIGKALKLFARTSGKGVWCVPVSTYGFVPGNGGINYDPNNASLLVRPPRPDRYSLVPETPYSYQEAWEFWHPFCTLDPFIFIATGDRLGTLIHTIEELRL